MKVSYLNTHTTLNANLIIIINYLLPGELRYRHADILHAFF